MFDVLKKHLHKAEFIQNSKHVACISYKGRLLSLGYNQRKSHPFVFRFEPNPLKPYLHAEISCLIDYMRKYGTEDLHRCDMHIIRLTKGGNIGMSKPCKSCQKALDAFNLKNVYWSENASQIKLS